MESTPVSYTVSEVEELRQLIETKWLFGTYHPGKGCSRAYKEADKTVAVERLVQTHMLAGHKAADLLAAEPEPSVVGLEIVDMSEQMFGKYQYCTQHIDGLMYADSDFEYGKLRKGALPSPFQGTKEQSDRAKAMHEDAAKATASAFLDKRAQPKSRGWRKWLGL